MEIKGIDWDDGNMDHLAKHNVTESDIGDVCFGKHIAYKCRRKRYLVYGQTRSGRYIKIVVEKLYDKMFRPITAFDMNTNEKQQFRKVMK